MMLNEKDLKTAAELIARAQHDLGYRLSLGQQGDLLADNHNDWSVEKCKAIVQSLNGTSGVGPFHMAEAWKKYMPVIPMVQNPWGRAPDYSKPGVAERVRAEVDEIEAMCYRKGRD
jgi:hypothetical protein